jgi:hypothetical protein
MINILSNKEKGRDMKSKLLYFSSDSEPSEEIAVVEHSETGDRTFVFPLEERRKTVGFPSTNLKGRAVRFSKGLIEKSSFSH